MNKCPYCAKENNEDIIECIFCGGDLSLVSISEKALNQVDDGVRQDGQQAIGFEYIEKQPPLISQKVGEKMARVTKVIIFWFGCFGLFTIIKLFNGSLRVGLDLYWFTLTALLNSMITLGVMAVIELIGKKIKPSPGQENYPDAMAPERDQVDTVIKKKVETRISVMYLRTYKVFRWILAFYLLVTGFHVIRGELGMSQALELLGIYLVDTFQWITALIVPYWLYVFIRYKWKTIRVPMKIFLVFLAIIVAVVGFSMLFFLLLPLLS